MTVADVFIAFLDIIGCLDYCPLQGGAWFCLLLLTYCCSNVCGGLICVWSLFCYSELCVLLVLQSSRRD